MGMVADGSTQHIHENWLDSLGLECCLSMNKTSFCWKLMKWKWNTFCWNLKFKISMSSKIYVKNLKKKMLTFIWIPLTHLNGVLGFEFLITHCLYYQLLTHYPYYELWFTRYMNYVFKPVIWIMFINPYGSPVIWIHLLHFPTDKISSYFYMCNKYVFYLVS